MLKVNKHIPYELAGGRHAKARVAVAFPPRVNKLRKFCLSKYI
jgi:hypothetical protein